MIAKSIAKRNLYYVLIAAAGLAIALAVQLKASRDMAAARENYAHTSKNESEIAAKKISASFTQIYQGIRTISLLPSVKTIDRYGKNLDANAHESIIQIYNNLRSNVAISEVYIVPVSLEPEQIDPVTGSLEIPILMFDDAVAAHQEDEGGEEEKITTIAAAEKADEVEIFEYRALKEQMTYLKQQFAHEPANKMDLPMIGSPGVLTCDNGDYEKTKNDEDRTGIMLSVPFYGNDGKLKGTVTAVLRNNVAREMLPESNAALVNKEYNYLILPKTEGQEAQSKEWAIQKMPDPSLYFSAVEKMDMHDPRSEWAMWAGYPNTRFDQSSEASSVRQFKYFGFGFALLFTLLGFAVYGMIQRNFHVMQRNNAELERKVAERAQQMEALAQEQEAQKKLAEQERKQALMKMASEFENSVQEVVAQVVAASAQMQSGAEGVTRIAQDTSSRSGTVSTASESAARTTAQVSSAARELTASITEISSQTQKSSGVAQQAASQAGQARQAIESLSQQSNKVSEIVGIINAIAGQINLLALNATIESARAGEAGRGFAVVASEVKQLATQVNRATEEISAQIEQMRSATVTSVDSVMSIIDTINSMMDGISAVAAAVEEQSAVTNEIARNISITATGAQDISENIVAVREGAEKTGETANQVLGSARMLAEQSSLLKHKVEQFLATVRAG